jgi:translation initiation factor 3 subunit D
MCANRSVYSWDIVVTKKDGIISFDKRDGSTIDRITVDENAQDPPSDATDSNINNVNNLSLEGTFINQNFLANSVIEDQTIQLPKPNPFHDGPADKLLSKGYKYKKFTLQNSSEDENPISVIIRTEFDSRDPATSQTISIKAVNEYANTGLDWKTKFNSQRGAIIAAQLKNNNNKFAKWANQTILAGVDQIKLGFISRVNFKDNNSHTILGVASYKPADLASQINLSVGNGWGIVKSFIDIIGAEDDGKFLILKNPNAPKLTLYRIPENSFQDE